MTAEEQRRRTIIGLALAAGITAAWLFLHVYMLHFFEFSWQNAVFVPIIMAIQCWLAVGLFIVSHDCIHGSLAPGKPGVNRMVGWIVTTIYAGFSYDHLEENHNKHHEAPGTERDPDFSTTHTKSFVPWFKEFFLRHFGWRPLLFVNSVVLFHWLVLGAGHANLVLFYGIPSLLSAVQLFYFGTYRPHRHVPDGQFADRHRTRTSDWPWLVSLMSCYHFGYHHEHHLYPHEPWWRLPARRGDIPKTAIA